MPSPTVTRYLVRYAVKIKGPVAMATRTGIFRERLGKNDTPTKVDRTRFVRRCLHQPLWLKLLIVAWGPHKAQAGSRFTFILRNAVASAS